MKTDFKLTGLNRTADNDIVATCEPLNKEEIFHAPVKMSDELKQSLWDFCEGDWVNKKIAVIEHEGFYESGLPINPVLITIKLVNDNR